jgi:ribonuclease HI
MKGDQTILRTEIASLKKAMEILPDAVDVEVLTDSDFLRIWFLKSMQTWRNKGFVRTNGYPIENLDLVYPIYKMSENRKGIVLIVRKSFNT